MSEPSSLLNPFTPFKMNMMETHIVLGSLFGDEGKGKTVQWLCKKALDEGKRPVVIRFSGGPQAGHTVVHEGKRHVFSHIGSGALLGVPTYWSEYCLTEPGSLCAEVDGLYDLMGNDFPVMNGFFISPHSQVITPIDRLRTQMGKAYRDNGTCGLGIGAAMERIEKHGLTLTVADLYGPKWVLKAKLDAIVAPYIHYTANEMFAEQTSKFMRFINNMTLYKVVKQNLNFNPYAYDVFIFEGSQGILLDREKGIFPHVTYAHTTSKNAFELIRRWDLPKPTTWYVTRAYITRHGNGPIGNHEGYDLGLINNENETNVTNTYQGEFRTAPFDRHLLAYATLQNGGFKSHDRLVVTCMDQFPGDIPVQSQEGVIHLSSDRFIHNLEKTFGQQNVIINSHE